MKTGIYCGSFSPVHNGHVLIANEVINENLADRLLFVPSGDYWDKKVSIPLNKRIECLKLFESDRILVDEDPVDCTTPTTWQLFERLKKKYPEDEFSLILGADNLLKFEKWSNAQKLLDEVHFIIMKRTGIDAEKELERLHKTTYSFIDAPEFNVSSTYIRDNLDHPELLKGLVDPRVLQLLKQ